MSLLILTGYDDAMREIGDLTTPGKLAYAQRHGYDFKCVRNYNKETHPSWQKLYVIWENLNGANYVLWLDADSVITNPSMAVGDWMTRHNAVFSPMVVSADWSYGSPWCAGNMLLNNTANVEPLLRHTMAMGHARFANAPLWDQSALQEHVPAEHIQILPRRILNAVPRLCRDAAPEPWEPGDFLAHCTCDDHGRRLQAVKNALEAAKEYHS